MAEDDRRSEKLARIKGYTAGQLEEVIKYAS